MKHNWKYITDPEFEIWVESDLIQNRLIDGQWDLFKVCLNCNEYVYRANNKEYFRCTTKIGINPIECEEFIIKNIIE